MTKHEYYQINMDIARHLRRCGGIEDKYPKEKKLIKLYYKLVHELIDFRNEN